MASEMLQGMLVDFALVNAQVNCFDVLPSGRLTLFFLCDVLQPLCLVHTPLGRQHDIGVSTVLVIERRDRQKFLLIRRQLDSWRALAAAKWRRERSQGGEKAALLV